MILLGVGLTVVSVANVLTEHLYKRTAEVPLHKQNALLYSCGVAFNAVAFLFVAPSAAAAAGASDGFFHDYTYCIRKIMDVFVLTMMDFVLKLMDCGRDCFCHFLARDIRLLSRGAV